MTAILIEWLSVDGRVRQVVANEDRLCRDLTTWRVEHYTKVGGTPSGHGTIFWNTSTGKLVTSS